MAHPHGHLHWLHCQPHHEWRRQGLLHELFVGVVGSYAGTFISHLLNIELFGKGFLTNFVFCLLGAVVVLWIWRKLFG